MCEGWQKIETAPKDGTTVLLYIPDAGGGIACGHWDVRWCASEYLVVPTHWRALPPPPHFERGDANED